MLMNRWFSVAAVLGLMVSGGCGSQHEEATSIISRINDSNGKRLANLYAIHQLRNNFTGPTDKAAFVKFIQQGMLPSELEGTGVDQNDVEKLFVSERDKSPFFIRYGVVAPSGGPSNQAVIFEEQGRGGRIAVFLTGPKVIEIAPAEAAGYREGKHDVLPAKPVSAPPTQGKAA
jgi:hypothetical protein